MIETKPQTPIDAKLDSFFQLTIHKITPKHPKHTVDTSKTIIVADLIDLSQSSKQTYNLNQKGFTEVKETLTFGYCREALLDNPNIGLKIYLKTIDSDNETSVFAHHSLNINTIIYSDSRHMESRWIPMQSVEKQEQVTAFICISAVALRLIYVADIPLFDSVSSEDIETLGLKDNDIPGNLNLERNSIRISLFDLEYIHNSIDKFEIELIYGNVALRSQEIDAKNYSMQYFELSATLPVVNEHVILTLFKNEKAISVLKKPILDFVFSDKKRMIAFNFTDKSEGTLVARIVGAYETSKGRINKPSFMAMPLESNRAIEMAEKKQFKLAIDCASVGNLDAFDGDIAGIKIKWGNSEKSVNSIKVTTGQLILNRRITLDAEFTFTDENFDFLPCPEFYIIDKKNKILFWKSIPIKDAHIIHDEKSDMKIQFRSYLMFNKQDGEYTPLVHLKLFLYESEKQLSSKRLSARPDTTKDPCYFMINLFSLSSKKTTSGVSTASLIIKHNNVSKTIELKKFTSHVWLNTKLAISSYRLDHLISPIYVQLIVEGSVSRDAVIDYVPALDGLPQRYSIDGGSEINLSIQYFSDVERFKNSIILNQGLYKMIRSPYASFLNNTAPVSYIKPDTSRYRVSINIWKMENFTSEINRIKIKNPCLSLLLAPFHMIDQTNKDFQHHIINNKYMFPRNPSVQHNLIKSEDMQFGSQIELEFKLPTDFRLIPNVDIIFLEKDVTHIDDALFNQLSTYDELLLGSCKIDLFKLLVENKIILFKRLNKLYNSLPKLNLKNKDQIKEILRSKLNEIEDDLEFNLRYKHGSVKPIDEDARKIAYRALQNIVEGIKSDGTIIAPSETKATNCFYAVKSGIIQRFNNESIERYSQLNLSVFKPPKPKETVDIGSARLHQTSLDGSNFNHFMQDSFISKTRTLTKYVLNETTMQSVDQFLLKPQYINVDGSKKEIETPSSEYYYKVGSDSDQGCHYRFVLPCSLESSIYLEDYSSWTKYRVDSFRGARVADIRSKINIIDDHDKSFFDKLDAYGIDTKLVNLQAGEIFGSYTPNEKIKLNIYLVDMLLHGNVKGDEIRLEVKADENIIKLILLEDLYINKEGVIDILETVEICTNLGQTKFIHINLIRKDIEFNETVVIAETTIDVEQRYFCNAWHRLKHKPIETRLLQGKNNNNLIGECRLWLDIHRRIDNRIPQNFTLKKQYANELEARLVVWSLEGYEGTSSEKENHEVYIQGTLCSTNDKSDVFETLQQTPSRFTASSIIPLDFNHRMVWRFKSGKDSHQLRLIIHNASNDSNLDAHIDLTDLCKQAIESGRGASKAVDEKGNPADLEVQMLPTQISLRTSRKDNFSFSRPNSKIRIMLEVLPLSIAKSRPAGKGRSHPNAEPYLPEPVRGVYPQAETIREFYKSVPKSIKVELTTYLFVFLLSFVIILLLCRELINLVLYRFVL